METPRLTCNVVNSDCMNANTSPQPVVYDIDILLNIYMFDFKDQTLFSKKLDSFPTPQQRTRTYMARLLGSPMPFTKSKASQNCFQEKQLNTHHPHGSPQPPVHQQLSLKFLHVKNKPQRLSLRIVSDLCINISSLSRQVCISILSSEPGSGAHAPRLHSQAQETPMVRQLHSQR